MYLPALKSSILIFAFDANINIYIFIIPNKRKHKIEYFHSVTTHHSLLITHISPLTSHPPSPSQTQNFLELQKKASDFARRSRLRPTKSEGKASHISHLISHISNLTSHIPLRGTSSLFRYRGTLSHILPDKLHPDRSEYGKPDCHSQCFVNQLFVDNNNQYMIE